MGRGLEGKEEGIGVGVGGEGRRYRGGGWKGRKKG